MFLKRFILLFLIPFALYSKHQSLYPFMSYAIYNGYKKSEILTGVYYTNIYNSNKLYAGLEYRNYTYSDKSSQHQADVMIGNDFSLKKNQYIYIMLHYITSDKDINKNSYIVITDYFFKKKRKFDIGILVANSFYNKYALAKYILQINPYWGVWFGDKNSLIGKIYSKIGYIYQNHQQTNFKLDKSYNIFYIKIKQHKKNFINSFEFNYGKNANIVKDKGFTIYSLPEIHRFGFALSSSYIASNDIYINFSYINENFDDIDIKNQTTKKSIMNRFLLSCQFNF